MAGGPLSTYGFYQYNSDNGIAYEVKLQEILAVAGGFTAVAPDSLPEYPKRWRMRYIWGQVVGNTARAKLHCASGDAAPFAANVVGFTWTGNAGVSYVGTGAIGEKRKGLL